MSEKSCNFFLKRAKKEGYFIDEVKRTKLADLRKELFSGKSQDVIYTVRGSYLCYGK